MIQSSWCDGTRAHPEPAEDGGLHGIELHARVFPYDGRLADGGDWYDAFTLRDGRIAIAIGDVCGHGAEAAAAAGRMRLSIRRAALLDPSPASVLRHVNRVLLVDRDALPVTAIYGIVDTKRQEFIFANAGHPSPITATTAGAAFLHCTQAADVMLGVDRDSEYVMRVAPLCEERVLVLYTDGVVERYADYVAGERELLHTALGSTCAADPAGAIAGALGLSASRDDIALVTIRLR